MAATSLTQVPQISNIGELYGSSTDKAAALYAKKDDLTDKTVFINLMMTQMKNQDPLDPMDNQQFLSQLAQLTTVEELRNANTNLESLALYSSSMNNAQAVSLIGKTIRANGNSFDYDGNGSATMKYKLDGDAAKVSVTVYDSEGALVKTIELGSQSSGQQSVTWDGTNFDGSPLEAGNYTYKVTATDTAKETVNASTFITGTIDSIAYENGAPVLKIGDNEVKMGDILEVMMSR